MVNSRSGGGLLAMSCIAPTSLCPFVGHQRPAGLCNDHSVGRRPLLSGKRSCSARRRLFNRCPIAVLGKSNTRRERSVGFDQPAQVMLIITIPHSNHSRDGRGAAIGQVSVLSPDTARQLSLSLHHQLPHRQTPVPADEWDLYAAGQWICELKPTPKLT